MHIYIDESGIFTHPSNKPHAVSCIGALALPTSKKKDIFREFQRLSYNWAKENGEVKGKLLQETEIASLTALLKKHDVLFDCVVFDMGQHPDAEITKFKTIQSNNIIKPITDEFPQSTIDELHRMKEGVENLSNQLFMQMMGMFLLIPKTLQQMIWYYARRIPKELQWFYWTVDAKDSNKTNSEEIWSKLIFPIMAGQSFQNPVVFVEGGDYSYYEKFVDKDSSSIREAEREKGLPPGTLSSTRLEDVLAKHFTFQNSKFNPGLQMVDVITNAVQRALNGKLGIDGWGELGRLMLHRNPNPIQLVKLRFDSDNDQETVTTNSPYFGVIERFTETAKPLWLDSETEKKLIEKFPAGEGLC